MSVLAAVAVCTIACGAGGETTGSLTGMTSGTTAAATASSDAGTSSGGDDSHSDGNRSEASLAMVFSSQRTENFEIWASDADGSSPAQLTEDSTLHSWWPRVSPDGQTVLFYRSPSSAAKDRSNYEQAALWSMRIDGSDAHELIPAGSHGWTAQGVVDWAPDGRQLIMAAHTSHWQLFTAAIDATGDGPPTLNDLHPITSDNHLYLDPSWSPDGSRIAYVRIPPDHTDLTDLSALEVYTAKPDGSDERRLTHDGFRDHDPYFSPDGAEIAFESDVDPTFAGPFGTAVGGWALRSVPADGGPPRDVINDGNINTLPEWLPDGSGLYFHRLTFAPLRGWHIARIARDGSGLSAIDTGVSMGNAEPDLFWRENGG